VGNHKFVIEERRLQVASLLARSMTQQEIGDRLGVDQSVISDDVRALREMSQQFIFDLARSDLASYYKQCLDGIDEVRREAWGIIEQYQSSFKAEGYRLSALKIIIQAEEARFKLLTEGPSILQIKAMEQKLDSIEQSFAEANR
jgi:IS30 family transposase